MLRNKCFAGVAAALMLCVSSPAAATPARPAQTQQTQQDDAARLQAAIVQMRSIMLQPGPRVEGWDRGGVDVDAELRALGPERFYLLTPSTQGRDVGILTDRPIADFVPAGWRLVDSLGRAGEILENPAIHFVALSPRFVVAGRDSAERRRDVDCTRGVSHAQLFEIPDAPAGPDDEDMDVFFRMMILAFNDVEICVRSEGDPRSGYQLRHFLPDGTSLPQLDQPGVRTTIVPAAPIDQLLRGD